MSAPAPPPTGPGPALAHSGMATPDELWVVDPPAMLALAATAVALALLVRSVRRRPGRLGGADRFRLAGCCVGVAIAAIAVLSPLHALADALFAAHMVQHLLLITVAAPLIVRGVPVVLGRRRIGPASWWALPAATVAMVVTFTGWHAPALYEWAVRDPVVHSLEHLTMFGAALAYWAAVAGSVARGRDLFAVGAIGVSGLAGVALGALLALSRRPWYGVHVPGADAWGIDPLADQQLGGMIMWVPGGAANLVAAALIVLRFLQRHEDPPRHPMVRSSGLRPTYPGAAMAPPGLHPPPIGRPPELRR
jgi:putative membrane protein